VAPEEVERFRSMDNRVSSVVAELLDFAGQYYRDTYGYAGYPIHDAVAVAQVIDDAIVETEEMRVDVETSGEFTAGRTVCDVIGVVEEREPNAAVGIGLNRDAFMEELNAVIESY
jgi:inosine-uridine nucleoside N-ribohydrolase